MPLSYTKRAYHRNEFTSLVGSLEATIALIDASLRTLELTAPIGAVSVMSGSTGVEVEWYSMPTVEDVAAVDAHIPTIVGGTTTSEPFVYQSFAVSQSTSNTHATKIDETTPPLDAGTYQVSWSCSLRMASVVANTGVEGRIRLERSDGQAVEQDDAWDRANRHAYNGSQPFQIAAGQTIRALLTFARLGASNTAEISGARITIDKIN